MLKTVYLHCRNMSFFWLCSSIQTKFHYIDMAQLKNTNQQSCFLLHFIYNVQTVGGRYTKHRKLLLKEWKRLTPCVIYDRTAVLFTAGKRYSIHT